MPRRKKVDLSIEERITAVEAELEALAEQTRNKKQELKALKQEKDEADKAKIIEAFISSGKTVEEAISLLKPE